MFKNSNTENTIKLCVLAALADGQVSQQERDTLITEITRRFGEDSAKVAEYIQPLLSEYEGRGFGSNMGAALDEARNIIRGLRTGLSRDNLSTIHSTVIRVTGADGMSQKEQMFTPQLGFMFFGPPI